MTAEMAGFIDSQRTDHGVPHAVSLRALDVAPSTFYKHLNRALAQVQVRRQALDAEVKRVFGSSWGAYGSPRVRARLRRDGMPVSKKAVEASMARRGLSARPNKKKGLTSQNPAHTAPEDLLRRDFSASGVKQKQCSGFKEVNTAEGPVFLATVLDLCSRRMVGFATSDSYPTAELAKAAINTAVATRGGNIDGVIFHSDRGSRAGFSRSSRHLGLGVFDGSPATSGGSGDAAEVEVAWSSEVSSGCRSGVLGGDRQGFAARGGIGGGRCGAGCGRAVVPQRWRHAAVRRQRPAFAPLSVFRGAWGGRCAVCPGQGGARDRAGGWP